MPGQFHVGGAQVDDGHEDVDCRRNRPCPGQDKADYPVIHAGADQILVHRIIDRGQRRIGGPARMEGVSRKIAEIYEESAHQVQPVAEGVHPRERDVASPDHQGREIDHEPGEHGHDGEKYHRRAVHRENLVVGLGGQPVIVRSDKLGAHDQRQGYPRQEEQQRGRDIHDPYLLMVHGGEPAQQAFVFPDLQEAPRFF